MWEDIIRFRRGILVILVLIAGIGYGFLVYVGDRMLNSRKLTSDTLIVGSALKDYKTRNGGKLPSSLAQLAFDGKNIFDYRYGTGGEGFDDGVSPTDQKGEKIDLEFFTMCPPGTRIGKSAKLVFAIGDRRGVGLLNVIYVDGSVGFEMKP